MNLTASCKETTQSCPEDFYEFLNLQIYGFFIGGLVLEEQLRIPEKAFCHRSTINFTEQVNNPALLDIFY